MVRRIPDLNHDSDHGQATLFDTWRFHAFFTTTDLDTVTADKIHRGHAIIEQDARRPQRLRPGSSTLGTIHRQRRLAGAGRHRVQPHPRRGHPHRHGPLAKCRTATIRRTLVTVPARIASSARRLTLHLPRDWPWESAWNTLFDSLFRRHQPLIA